MELILLKDVERVGRKGDAIRVRDGFARNFLLPQKLALVSNRANQKFVEEQKSRTALKREKEKTQALTLSDRLKQTRLVIAARAGEQDKLFGSVTSEDVREALTKQGFSLDKKQIHLEEPIRSLGNHTVTIEVYPQVKTVVGVEVIPKK